MKVAVLMLAHKNKMQLERLISILMHPSIDIYIHLDEKSYLNPEDFQHLNVRFTEKRFNVRLFDFSMVEAEMELIQTAMSTQRYNYYILLSGQDYPLRHINDIYNYLCEKYPKPFIEVISPEVVTKFAIQFQYPHILKKFRTDSEVFLKKLLPTKSIYPYKYISEGIARLATMVHGVFVKSPKERLKAMGVSPYFGPQWWILPDIVIDEILLMYDNKDYCNCIKYCFSCDETFFQTAIMVHAERFGIKLDDKGYYRSKKTFTIFSHGHPILLKQEHYNQIISSNLLFARKFDIETDVEIMDMLDRFREENLQE